MDLYKWNESPQTASFAGRRHLPSRQQHRDQAGGDCDAGVEGVYSYTLSSGEFTQQVENDPCELRTIAFDGVVFTTAPPSGG